MELQSSIPKNLKFGRSLHDDEPKPNMQRHLIDDDSEGELPIRKQGLKLEAIKHSFEDDSDEPVQRATTLPQAQSNNLLDFVTDSPPKNLKLGGGGDKECRLSQLISEPSSPAVLHGVPKHSSTSVCLFDDEVKKTQSQIILPNKPNQFANKEK